MVSRRFGSTVVVAGLCLLCGCSGGSPEGRTIRQAETLILYEGLPHPMYEAGSLESEKKSKATTSLHGFPFYRETLALRAGDEERLKAVLGDARSFKPFSGEKKCGGFHPDYAVGWSAAGKPYVCLICFGCGEVRLYGPAGEADYDIPIEPRERLKGLLASYQKNRPPPAALGP